MTRPHAALALAGVLGLAGCSDSPQEPPDSAPRSGLIVSEAHHVSSEQGALAAAVASVAYASLPPGSLFGVVRVRIRNRTAGGGYGPPVPVVEDGFDPVAVPAAPGDRLVLQLFHTDGEVTEEESVVPIRRPPVVVRLAPAGGRTDVALLVRPVVVFSEPVQPATLAVGMRLLTGGTRVSASIEPREPWRAELVPDAPLAPGTRYRLEVTREVLDTDGVPLEAAVSAEFTTEAGDAAPPVALSRMRLAFVSSRDGVDRIYLANGDGSGVSALTTGTGPAWSWDDRRIAFHRQTPSGPVVGVINADGTGERVLVPGTYPAWSPDGRIAFVSPGARVGGISVMNADGTGSTLLLSHDFAAPDCIPPASLYAWWGDCVTYPQWSPDGRRIAFFAGDAGYSGSDVYVMASDGSSPVLLLPHAEQHRGGWNGRLPTWAPDGSRVAFAWGGPDPIISALAPDGSDSITGMAGGNDPSWSPDGRWIAYTSYAPGLHVSRIVATDVVTGEFYGQLIPEAEAPVSPDYGDASVEWGHTIR
jgi:Tol biopolymer transport system component